ncbi:MAG: glycosyl transferase, partial [Proteobacteria bacterium]|nr:glycosyl transferase [Pseudomonadota bacterium]
MKVVQLLPALNGGGVERGTLEVAQELVRRGHRSIVISAGGRLVEELVDQGSEHLCWPVGSKSLLAMRWIWPLRRWLSEQRIDVLHVRSRMPAWIAWLAWRGMDPAT